MPRPSQLAAGPSKYYYARRAGLRASRQPLRFQVPVKLGIPGAARKEDAINLRQDVLGPMVLQHYPVLPDQTRQSLMAAFDKRCNYHSDQRVDASLLSASESMLARLAPAPWDPIVWDRKIFDEWNSQFDPPKQARHNKVYPIIAECTDKQFSAKQIFVKMEALLKRSDPNWAPRIIYQSSDIHNAILGPVMRICTKRMFSALELDSSDSQVNYLGAYSKQSEDMVKRINRHGTEKSVYIESDFRANDMKQVYDVHMLEAKWMTAFGAPLWLTSMMLHANSIVVTNHKHQLKALVRNQLPTGAQSTTFRNTMWNVTINHAFCLRVKAKGDCLVLGDDMLMRLDNPFSSRAKNIRREYEHVCRLARMDADVKVRKHLVECEFLSREFIATGPSYVLVPLLPKTVGRFNARATSNLAVSDSSYLAGKSLSYAYEFRAAPDLARLFLLKYVQLDADVSLDGLGWNAKGAFLRRGVDGILADIDAPCLRARRDDLNVHYHTKYGLMFSDVRDKLTALLFGEEDLDADGLAFLMAGM